MALDEKSRRAAQPVDAVPIALKRWASLAARQMGKDALERAGLRKHAGVDAAAWAESDEHWRRELRNDVGAGRTDRIGVYGAECVAERDRRAAAALAAPPIEPLPEHTLVGAAAGAASPLPFVRPPAGAQAPAAGRAAPAPPPHDAGDTIGLTHEGTDAPLPFAPQAAGVELTLEQYAALRAELGVYPEQADEITARYRLSDAAARRALDESWRKRFASERAEQARFLELAARYRDRMLEQKSKRR